MSYSNSSANSLRSPVAPGDSAGYDRFIDQQVAKTGSQVKLVDICSSLMVLGAGVLSFLLIVTVLDHWIISLGTGGRWTALAVLACGAGWYLVRVVLPVLFGRVNPLFAARTIEHSDPSLKNSLINFLLFRSDRAGVRSGVYQALEQRAAADLSHVPVDTAVDRSRLIKIGYLLAGVLAVCAAYTILAPKSPFQSVARILAPWADIDRPSRVRIEEVQPGNVEVFQGERIVVSADCYDLRRDEPVTVQYTTLDEQRGRQAVTMQPVAGNLRHECRLPPDDEGFQRDVMYWVEAGDARTPAYRVRVIPAPVILVESIQYEYPPHTKLPKRVVERQGDIKAVEGTRITVRARANQPILAAVLVFDPPAQNAEATLAAADRLQSGPLATSAHRVEMEFREQEAWCSFVCELDEQRKEPKHRTYQLRFSTQGGHRNPQPVLHRIEVLRDLPPEVEILTPVQDRVEVPEDGWQKIEIRAVDPDFGLTAIRLQAVAGGRQVLKQNLLLDPAGRSGQEIARFDFAPRACGMRAGTEAKCWAIAEDNRTAPKTGSPEPNIVKSRELTLVVTRPAAPTRSEPGDAEKQEPTGKPSADSPQENAGDKPPPGGQPSQDSPSSQESQPPSSGQENSEAGQGGQDQGNAAKQPSGGGEGSSGSGQQGGDSNETQQSGGTGGDADSSASQSGGDSPPEGGNMPGDGNSESTSGTDGSQGGAGSGSSPPGAGGAQGGNTGGSDSSGGSTGGEGGTGQSAEPLHDGEAFEKTLQHMQQAAQGQGKEGTSSGGAESPTADQGGQKPSDAPGQDASQQGGSTGAGKPSKSAPGGQPQPAGGAGQSGGQDEPQAPKPDESPAGASGQQGGPEKPSPGQPPGEKSPGAGQPQPGSSGSDSPQQGPSEQQGGEPKPSQSGSGQPKEQGTSEGGQSGSGQPNEDRGGSAGGQNPEGTSQKRPSSGGGEPSPSQEPQSPSMSKKAGGAQGDAGGDQSGGGKQGGGQGGQQPGNDKPGGTSPGDQGAGAAQESGQGDLAQRPGDKQESQERTGASGYDPGTGTTSKPAAEGTAGAGAQGESPQGGPSPSVPKTPTDGAPSERGQGLPLGGGAPSSAELQGPDLGGEVPDGEQPNIEYARKATDLVLEYLKDQESNPDEDLLKKLGWTKDDLQDFARRWADLKRAASEDPRAKQQLDDALRSLGLRPAARDPRRSDVQQDTRRTERNLGDRSRPPSAYSELFDAYRKGTGRVGKQ
jgi:hypothetical protein